jgi:hypothetical protein
MDFNYDITELSEATNIVDMLTVEEAEHIAGQVVDGYRADMESRSGWEKQMKQANKIALQIMEEKNTPWPKSSNIKFPLMTVGSLQFAARAYPALIKTPEIVKCRTIGADPGGEKKARAERVSAHMSYQVLEEDEAWEEHTDKLLMILPIAGCAFKKSYYDVVAGHNKSELVLAQDLVLSYYTKSMSSAERMTHKFCLFPREIRERELGGIYTEYDHGEPDPEVTEIGDTDDDPTAADERQGLEESPVDATAQPYTMLEQHLYLDLDGDRYAEPYVATVLADSGKLVRLVNRFRRVHTKQDDLIAQLQQQQLMPLMEQANQIAQQAQEAGQDPAQVQLPPALLQQIDAVQLQIVDIKSEPPDVLSISALEFFTKFPFIPSPDGGIYDLGFGALLGPINASVNSLINQLIDSGTLQNGSMGFLGRSARFDGGEIRFRPYEWKRVDVAGSALRDAIVPLPVNEPSPVLFNLLGLLITYGEKITSVTDVMLGENVGQNTPAYNMQQMQQSGMAVFTGIFKRIHRSLRDEFRKLYQLNSLYLSEQEYFQVLDGPTQDIFQRDYMGDPKDIKPAADPNAILSEEKMRQAAILVERSQMAAGYDPVAVEMRLLEAMGVQDVQEIFPLQQDEEGNVVPVIPPPPDPEFQIKGLEEQRRTLEAQNRDEVNRMDSRTKAHLASAQMEEIEARAIKLLAEAGAIEGKEDIERQQLILQRIGEQREAVKMLITAENEREKIRQERARAMADKSDNGGGAGSA